METMNNTEKQYRTPAIEIILLSAEDVIRTSSPVTPDSDGSVSFGNYLEDTWY